MTYTRLIARVLTLSLLPVSMGAIAQQTSGPTVVDLAGNASGQSASPSQPNLQVRYPRYVIQRSDSLFLTFPLSPEFNQTVTVQPDGYINLQNMQSVYAVGMTVPEVVTALKAAYSGTLHAPIINVDLVDFQKPFFTVTGQVGKPGQYELRANITAEEALATAGGMSPTAKTQVLLFRRRPDSSFEMRKLNIKAALAGNHEEDNPLLQPGDMLFVPEKFITNFKKYVPYTTSTGTYVSP